MRIKESYYIMGGHMADDLCQGSLPAVLAFMYQEGRLDSFADVALLIMATTIINALVQPIAGYLADQKPRPYLMPLGMLTAGLGVMFLGYCQNFWVMFALIALNGVGVAVFHPAAGKLANIFAGQKVGRGMSIFSVGGNIGYAVGPLYFTAFYMVMGLHATLLLIVPGILMTLLFWGRQRKYEVYSKRRQQQTKHRKDKEALKDDYFGTCLLVLLVFARSAAMFSLTAFLPLYFIHVLGQGDEQSALTITVMGLTGAAATLIGGNMADKFGFTQWSRFASVLVIPFALVFLLVREPLLAMLLLCGVGFFYYAAMSPIVVIGQKLLPLHVGMATGITVGLGISFGGIIAPVLGSIGDHYGLDKAMQVIAGLLVLAAALSFTVPIVNRPRGSQKDQKAKQEG